MSRVPDRKKMRRAYLRKRVIGHVLFSVSVLLVVTAVIVFLSAECLFRRGFSQMAVFSVLVGTVMMGLVGLKMSGHAEIASNIPYVPPVTPSNLPAEEVLVRGAEEPAAASEILL